MENDRGVFYVVRKSVCISVSKTLKLDSTAFFLKAVESQAGTELTGTFVWVTGGIPINSGMRFQAAARCAASYVDMQGLAELH